MTILRIVRNFWSRLNLPEHRLLPASTMPEKHGFIPCSSSSQTVDANSCDGHNNGPKLACAWSQSVYNPLGFIPQRGFVTTNVHFAKSKDRGKDRKKPTKVQIDMNELSALINVEKLTKQLEGTVNNLRDNYAKNLTIRSSIGSIEQIPIIWEGKEYKLQELSQIARKPKTVIVNVSAFPHAIPSILHAIVKSGMNLNPQQDGTTLFLPIPKVTKEHRENLAKSAKAIFIGCRDNLKEIQLRCIKSLKNETHVSVDVIHNTQSQIEALTDKFIDEAEAIFQMKRRELLGDSE